MAIRGLLFHHTIRPATYSSSPHLVPRETETNCTSRGNRQTAAIPGSLQGSGCQEHPSLHPGSPTIPDLGSRVTSVHTASEFPMEGQRWSYGWRNLAPGEADKEGGGALWALALCVCKETRKVRRVKAFSSQTLLPAFGAP